MAIFHCAPGGGNDLQSRRSQHFPVGVHAIPGAHPPLRRGAVSKAPKLRGGNSGFEPPGNRSRRNRRDRVIVGSVATWKAIADKMGIGKNGRLRFVLSPVPKCEGPGAPIVCGGTHFVPPGPGPPARLDTAEKWLLRGKRKYHGGGHYASQDNRMCLHCALAFSSSRPKINSNHPELRQQHQNFIGWLAQS